MINQYDVEMIVKDKQGHERSITLSEWAYDASDAFKQATYNYSKHLKSGEEFARIERIGPPLELIERATEVIRRAQEAFVQAVRKK